MLNAFLQSVVMLTVVLIFYTTDMALISRYDRERRAAGSGRSWGFTAAILAVAVLISLQPLLLPWASWRTQARWGLALQVLGIVLLAGALWLHAWARVHLRQFYAERVELQPDHQLICTGPYARVRHPLFLAYFMIATGVLLLNPSPLTLGILIYTLWDFTRAALQEERLLAANLPGYTEYAARTGRFFPRFGRPRGERSR
jgi:protein-S-isoprenylcysteine O-methyltransferase Ste14